MEHTPKPDKLNNLYVVLSGIFIVNALAAEFAGSKIFSLERLLGITSHQNLNLSVGVVIWPFVFVFSDIINEYFGKKGVRKISFITAALLCYSFLVIFVGTNLPPAQFWLDLNHTDPAGHPFNIDYAYSAVFRQSMGIIVGSVCAFLLSQMIDVYSFIYIKKFTGHKWLWLRATGSTIISQLFDSFVILFIAFYVFNNWSFKDVISVGIVQYIYKVLLAIAFTPLIYVIHFFVDRYLGIKH
jgi:queuosine precursor transporter